MSSTLLLAAAGLLCVIGRTSAPALAGRWKLPFLFLYVAMDETAQLHEFTIPPLRTALHLSGLFYFSWVVVAIPILAYLSIRYFPLLNALPNAVRRVSLVAAVIYFSGALGMEMISGAHAELHGYNTLTYKLMTDLEESLELVGIAIWIFALLTYLETLAGFSHSQRTSQAAVAG